MSLAAASPPAKSRDDSGRKAVLVGLLGQGIQRSRTPAMHEAAGQANGLAYVYRLLDPDRMGDTPPPLSEMVRFAEHFGFNGFNVTFPYKQEILPLLNELSPAARDVGSVNTVVLKGGRRVGHNTDIWGFRESFRVNLSDAARDTVLLIGGAGAAVAHALLDSEVGRLLVADTDRERATALVARLGERFGKDRAEHADDLPRATRRSDGIVNATPVGMAKLPGAPLPADLLRPGQWVADIIYFPLETQLLRRARRKGCRTMSGEGMAVFHAVRAFELFTGVAPDMDRMKAAFADFDGAPEQ